MSTSDTLRALGERLQAETPRAVFGEPIAAHGRTLIPSRGSATASARRAAR